MVRKEFINMKIDDLIPYKNNPRHNEEAVPDVAESIRQCGDLDPIEVDENNVILSGHTRLLALQQQGFTETDVIRYTGLTEEQKKKYRRRQGGKGILFWRIYVPKRGNICSQNVRIVF